MKKVFTPIYQLIHPAPTTLVTKIKCIKENNEIILEDTPFYAQGGGQPSDTGVIEGSDGAFLKVEQVKWVEDEIVHYCEAEKGGGLEMGEVKCKVDEEKRAWHCRIHSAGHLIDAAMEALSVPCTPSKAYHFPEGPYVEYQSSAASEIEVKALQQCIDKLIEEDLPIKMHWQGDSRLITIGQFKPTPCGGTHSLKTGELRGASIKKVSMKKKGEGILLKVSYSIQ